MRRPFLFFTSLFTSLFASMLSTSCTLPNDEPADPQEPIRSVGAPLTDGAIVIAGVNQRESTLGQHGWELYGSFDGFSQLRPEVRCNGALVSTRVSYASQWQINVLHVEQPSGATCSIALERITDGARSNVWGDLHPSPAIEIRQSRDAGVSGGRRLMDLYGVFGGPVAPRVLCDGVTVAARTEVQAAPWQYVRASWPNVGPASRCVVVLRQTATGLETPLFGRLPAAVGGAGMTGFGAYHWGGPSLPAGSTDTMGLGQAWLGAAGFDTARLVLDPIERSGGTSDWYRLGSSFCAAGGPVRYLPCVMRSAELAAALAPSGLRTVIFTAYDESRDHITDGAWIAAHAQAIHDEYYDAAMALYASQAGTGRTFVFANWETDNAVYCGSALQYALKARALGRDPRACDDGGPPPAARLAGMRAWFTLRRAAMADARAAAAASPGVTVTDGIEFNSVHLLQDLGIPSALGDIVAQVHPSFALYSSYDSQYGGTYAEDLAWLRGNLGSTSQLMVGEAGFPMHAVDGIDAYRTVEAAKAIQRAGLPAAVLWEAFDTGGGACGDGSDPNDRGCVHPTGVLEADGSDRLVSRMLRAALSSQARAIVAPHVAGIYGIVQRELATDARGTWRGYELYGSFPGGTYAPVVTCDGTDALAEVIGVPSVGQINVRIPHTSAARWCVFRMVRQDGESTLDFGPKLDAPY